MVNEDEQRKHYKSEVQLAQDFLQQLYQLLQEHGLGMSAWETEISTKLYIKPPTLSL